LAAFLFVDDIYICMPKKASKYKIYVLPSNFDEMERFIDSHKIEMTEHVISSIEYALNKNLSFVEVFSFKNSDFVVTIQFESFKENLKNVFDYYIDTENYELCVRVKSIETKLENTIRKKSHEKK
jgi:hypothetical protein